jgi:hypothetical protein
VFLACAATISLNFLMLLTYKEVGKDERLERRRLIKEGKLTESSLAVESLRELAKPHVWSYLLIFSGFWFMFNSLFDVLPAHIEDWVDTTDVVAALFGTGGTDNPITQFFVVLNKEGTAIQPEGMINLNAGMIMTTCFLFAYLSGRMRATTSMVLGTLVCSIALFLCGYATAGWIALLGIGTFSIGEMLSSPKFSEFIGNFAPSDKKAMYLGFSQVPLAIGWTLEGKLGPLMYDHFASKERFSRELLAERGMAHELIEKIPQGEAFSKLVEFTGESAPALTQVLADSHNIALVWNVIGAVGVVTAIGIFLYGRWILVLNRE